MDSKRSQKIESYIGTISAMHKAMGTQKDRFFQRYGLNRPQVEILYLVAHENSLSVKEIASRMRVTGSAATQTLDGLVHLGYLERVVDEKDRRVTHIRFSPKGKVKFEAFKKSHIDRVGKFLEILDDREFDILMNIPQKMITHLSDPSLSSEF